MAQDPYKYFRLEARELVGQLGKAILDLERSASPEIVARLLRIAHTLKGAARVVKQGEIADGAHALEDALVPLRSSASPLPRATIDELLAVVDDMSARVTALGGAPDATEAAPRASSPEPVRGLHADTAELDELLDGVTELHAQLAPARRSLGVLERARRLAELIADQLAAPRAPEEQRSDAGLETTRSLAEDLAGLLADLERRLSTTVDGIDRELSEVRRASEQIRLVPARSIFDTLERTVRDAAQALGKRVVFEGRGGDVRLDAQVLGTVQAALVQIVRNAVAHGIEPPEDRAAARKPPAGRVTLDVVRRGRFVVFVGKDDGRGVDLREVRTAAQKRGLLSSEAHALGTDELLGLLLKGGVTTSTTVTEVSGRGVGLDLVREAAERLSGEVTVTTRSGEGTAVELLAPVSVASVPGLLVDVAGTVATIPLDAVVQTLRIEGSEVSHTTDGQAVVHEGSALPFLALSRVLSARRTPPRGARPWSGVVVRGASGCAVVGVDRLLGTATVVLRPLPELAPASAIVAGASLDSEGGPRLVLDPDALVLAARAGAADEPEVERRPAPILVIDDSLTTRMLERSILESAGYEVDVAISGEEGLEKARKKRYALFLVDIEMPGMDGFTFIERTRADPDLRDVRAILVSSRASAEDRRRGEEAGAIDYMIKSEFDQGALLARIRAQVG